MRVSWRSSWGIPGGTPEIRLKSSVNWTQWLNFSNREVGKKTPEMALEEFLVEFYEKILEKKLRKNHGEVSAKTLKTFLN